LWNSSSFPCKMSNPVTPRTWFLVFLNPPQIKDATYTILAPHVSIFHLLTHASCVTSLLHLTWLSGLVFFC
jgi:hypothetical protein